MTGSGYTNLFHLAETAENIPGNEGVGPIGMGNSQALLGSVGLGKIVAFGDANGFTAMAAQVGDELILSGMSLPGYDWKQFVLNTLHWLSGELS